jgi:hypothetical protein
MKIGGVTVTAPVEEILVLPRGNQSLVFRAKALPDMEEFDALSPVPQPPGKRTKDGWVPEPNDPAYRTIFDQYVKRRTAYMVIRTLEPSQIEWETVDINNPKTWINWESDLRKAGMTDVELNHVVKLVTEANLLNEARLVQARELFLLGQALVAAESSGHQTEPATTQSGEPATASA